MYIKIPVSTLGIVFSFFALCVKIMASVARKMSRTIFEEQYFQKNPVPIVPVHNRASNLVTQLYSKD